MLALQAIRAGDQDVLDASCKSVKASIQKDALSSSPRYTFSTSLETFIIEPDCKVNRLFKHMLDIVDKQAVIANRRNEVSLTIQNFKFSTYIIF